jgi:hypothetical protein
LAKICHPNGTAALESWTSKSLLGPFVYAGFGLNGDPLISLWVGLEPPNNDIDRKMLNSTTRVSISDVKREKLWSSS